MRQAAIMVALLAMALAYTVTAQDSGSILARVEDRTRVGRRDRVLLQDPRSRADEEIYRSQGHIPYEVSLSPDGRYLGFIEVVSQTGAGSRRLTVIDRSGRIVRLLGESSIYAARGIRAFLWCCGPDTLAVVTGGLAEGAAAGESTNLPVGLSLVDLRTGVPIPIEGLRAPQQVHWSPFDSSLYIKDVPQVPAGTPGPVAWPVYRYHAPSKRLSLTRHQGVYFSPDGAYYFDTGVGEGSGTFRLYRTADDQEVTARLAVPRQHLGREGGWMPGGDHVLVFIEKPAPEPPKRPQLGERLVPEGRRPRVYPDRWNVTVDAETGRVIDRFQGDIRAGWKTNARALPVERRSAVELIRPRRP